MIYVRDLIKQLQQADPDAPVILMLNGTVREVTGITDRLCRQQFSMVSFPVYAVEILAGKPDDSESTAQKRRMERATLKWHYTDYPQRPYICLVETSRDYRLMWYNERNKWWYDFDTGDPYAKDTENFKWILLDDILENIE